MFVKNLIHGSDVHKVLYINYDIHGPWVRGSDPKAGPIWPCSKKVLYLRKSSLLPIHVCEKINEWL